MKEEIGELGSAPTDPQLDITVDLIADTAFKAVSQGVELPNVAGTTTSDKKVPSYLESAAKHLVNLTNIDFCDAAEVVSSRVDLIVDDRDIFLHEDGSGQFTFVGDLLDLGSSGDMQRFLHPLVSGDHLIHDKRITYRWNMGNPITVSFITEGLKFKRIEEEKYNKQFRFVLSDNLHNHPPNWLVKDYIEAEKSVLLFGAPASFKSFIVIDMGLSIATGSDWHGHNVNQGSVLYICGEGQSGIKKRIMAWEEYHNQNADNFLVSSSPVQILSEDSLETIQLAARDVCKDGIEPKLIIIDTLNRNFGDGDENLTSDMTKFIHGVDLLSRNLKCTTIIVHHTGLSDTKRSRGSSALRGAMDFEYLCTAGQDNHGDRLITLSSTKTKDHQPPSTKVFQILDQKIGDDDDGEPITSLVLIETTSQPVKGSGLSNGQKIALDALKTVIAKGNATDDAWKAEAYAQGITASENQDTKRKTFDRAKKHLLDQGLIANSDGIYEII